MKKLLLALVLVSTGAQAQYQGAWGLYDYELHEYQTVYNRSEVRPIASITKLFTATTILRSGVDLQERVKVQGTSGGRFPRGTMVSRNDLLKAMLISSDNLAAETLANTYPSGFNGFILDTNQWVQGLRLINTKIVDASGLLPGNVSNVDDLVSLLYRIKDYPVIRDIAREKNETLRIPKGKKKELRINLRNTNPSLFQFDNILISKTGFTNPAGRCVIMLVEKGRELHAVIILGQRNIVERSRIAEELITKNPLPKPSLLPPDEIIKFNFAL